MSEVSIIEVSPEQMIPENWLDLALIVENRSAMLGKFNPGHFFPTWQAMMKKGIARSWATATKDALVGVTFGPNIFTGVPTATAVFVAAKPGAAGAADRLLDRVDAEARATCVGLYGCVRRTSGRIEATQRWYRKRGYLPVEEHWFKLYE